MTELYSGGGLTAETEQNLANATEDVIDANVKACGDLVRQLKAEKAAKDKIKAEVDVLLKMKKIFKEVTGKDWKPGAVAESKKASPPPAPVVVESYTGGGLTPAQEKELETAAAEALDMKIKACGDLIRKLKGEKADKAQIASEVQVLLQLKGAFKKRTGQDWKPAEQAKKPETAKKVEQPVKAEGEKSDKQIKREAKKAEKQAKKAQHKSEGSSAANAGDQSNQQSTNESGEDVSVGKYGVAPMNQSQSKSSLHLIDDFAILTEKLAGQTVWVRARLHTSRAKGKQCFFVLRQQQFTVQCIAYVSEEVSKQMIKFIAQ